MGNSQDLLWKISSGVMFLPNLEMEVQSFIVWYDPFTFLAFFISFLFMLNGWFLIFVSGTWLLFQKLFGRGHLPKQCFDHI